MAWFGSSIYECLDCDGDGESECDCCGNEGTCRHCQGTGLDSSLVDVRAYSAAVDTLNKKMIAAGCAALTWSWLDDQGSENAVWLGRQGGEFGSVAIEDFLTSEGQVQKKTMRSGLV